MIDGRLHTRPHRPGSTIGPGVYSLDPGDRRGVILAVPDGYRPDQPAPLILSLHGAGGNAQAGLLPLRDLADALGIVLLSPSSAGRTWDVILSGFGPDCVRIDRALSATFDRCAIDPRRVAISGFSDGGSYALSLGITNGDLFPHIVAFSPGFAAPGPAHGSPRIFISHGEQDRVLPIDRTSRRIVPRLKATGYDVHYREFDGPHMVPSDIAREAMRWLLGPSI